MATDKERKTGGNNLRRATTSQILGGVVTPASTDAKWQPHLNALLRLRAELSQRRETHNETARQQEIVFSLHMADAGTDEFDRDFALSMISSDQNALYEIEQALNRIRDGTYGICELTGEPIEPERLEAIPWTRFSAEAQRQMEHTGVALRARLAPRGSIAEPTPEPAEEGEGETTT